MSVPSGMCLAGSEANCIEPGYLAGSAKAAGRTAREVMDRPASNLVGRPASGGAGTVIGGMEP